MKKMFSKKIALIYGCISICAIIGFVAIIYMTDYFEYLRLSINTSLLIHMVHPLFYTGIVFGGLTAFCLLGIDKPTIIFVLFLIGIFAGIFEGYKSIRVSIIGSYPKQLTAVAIYSEKTRNYDLAYGVAIKQTLCVSYNYTSLVDVYEGTKIYEQTEDAQQKRQVSLDALQPGQVVDIKGDLWVSDPEIWDFLLANYHPMNFDFSSPLIGATEITIHKGESVPVKNGEQCYGFMSQP